MERSPPRIATKRLIKQSEHIVIHFKDTVRNKEIEQFKVECSEGNSWNHEYNTNYIPDVPMLITCIDEALAELSHKYKVKESLMWKDKFYVQFNIKGDSYMNPLTNTYELRPYIIRLSFKELEAIDIAKQEIEDRQKEIKDGTFDPRSFIILPPLPDPDYRYMVDKFETQRLTSMAYYLENIINIEWHVKVGYDKHNRTVEDVMYPIYIQIYLKDKQYEPMFIGKFHIRVTMVVYLDAIIGNKRFFNAHLVNSKHEIDETVKKLLKQLKDKTKYDQTSLLRNAFEHGVLQHISIYDKITNSIEYLPFTLRENLSIDYNNFEDKIFVATLKLARHAQWERELIPIRVNFDEMYKPYLIRSTIKFLKDNSEHVFFYDSIDTIDITDQFPPEKRRKLGGTVLMGDLNGSNIAMTQKPTGHMLLYCDICKIETTTMDPIKKVSLCSKACQKKLYCRDK